MAQHQQRGWDMTCGALPSINDNSLRMADLFLRSQRFVTLKVHINTLQHNQELLVFQHLKTITASDHTGQHSIRMLQDFFEVDGPHGVHTVFVLPPLGISLRSLQERMPGEVFNGAFVRAALQQSIPALDFLHSDANITHTGKALLARALIAPLSKALTLSLVLTVSSQRRLPFG